MSLSKVVASWKKFEVWECHNLVPRCYGEPLSGVESGGKKMVRFSRSRLVSFPTSEVRSLNLHAGELCGSLVTFGTAGVGL
jgi:hypothetical protein